MNINNEFNLGEIVYLITDTEQEKRIVTGINLRQSSITYEVSCGVTSSWHYGFEISKEKSYNL